MTKFDILTIFPNMLDSYISESILARARKKKLIKIQTHDLRRWATDKHKTVDDKPYGGGPGMLFKVEPIFKAVNALKRSQISIRQLADKSQILRWNTLNTLGRKFSVLMLARRRGGEKINGACPKSCYPETTRKSKNGVLSK